MQVRSVPLLVAGIVLLLAAAALGAVLVHDGEVGTDEALLTIVQEGDEVRLKGEAVPCCERALEPLLRNHSIELEGPEERVIVTADEPLPDGSVVVTGEVAYVGLHADGMRMLVIHPETVDTPYVFG